jgi:hypothetical protein
METIPRFRVNSRIQLRFLERLFCLHGFDFLPCLQGTVFKNDDSAYEDWFRFDRVRVGAEAWQMAFIGIQKYSKLKKTFL